MENEIKKIYCNLVKFSNKNLWEIEILIELIV
jgi:hypothetical protein